MTISSDKFRAALINSILFAGSQEEVTLLTNDAVKSLERGNVSSLNPSEFADKIIRELDLFSPMNKDAQQWSNILMAKVLFNRIRYRIILQPYER